MKTTILVFLLFISSIYSQNIDFSLNAVDEQNLFDHSRNIANSSTLWLAGNINTPESSGKALYIKYSQSSLFKKINNKHWVLPNLQFGLMPSNNLMLSGNFFGHPGPFPNEISRNSHLLCGPETLIRPNLTNFYVTQNLGLHFC